jgi:hypothetical protein
MSKPLNLLGQKIKGLENLKKQVENNKESIQAAYDANLQSVNQKTNVDVARDWAQIQIVDSFEKGKKAGYAEACKDFAGVLNAMTSVIDVEDQALANLYQELKEVGLDESEMRELTEEEKSDPLASREKLEFSS